jgi:hypothetical protein
MEAETLVDNNPIQTDEAPPDRIVARAERADAP